MMKVADFMAHRVVTVAPDAPILDAARLMLDHKISGLPVVDATGRVVGIISEPDLLRQRDGGEGKPGAYWLQFMIEKPQSAGETARFLDRKVSEAMTPDPIVVAPSASVREACRLIEQHGVKRLPVVKDGKLVGIIARADLVRAFARATERVTGTAAPDVSVSEQIRELERQHWRDRARGSRPF